MTNFSAVQEESLRSYIFQYWSHYDSFRISSLASMFQLSESKVTNIISKMIFQGHLNASLDEKEENVHLDKQSFSSKLSKMEYLASYYADKISILSDMNEKLFDSAKMARV